MSNCCSLEPMIPSSFSANAYYVELMRRQTIVLFDQIQAYTRDLCVFYEPLLSMAAFLYAVEKSSIGPQCNTLRSNLTWFYFVSVIYIYGNNGWILLMYKMQYYIILANSRGWDDPVSRRCYMHLINRRAELSTNFHVLVGFVPFLGRFLSTISTDPAFVRMLFWFRCNVLLFLKHMVGQTKESSEDKCTVVVV